MAEPKNYPYLTQVNGWFALLEVVVIPDGEDAGIGDRDEAGDPFNRHGGR